MVEIGDSLKRGRKWVDKALLQMDPETDYERMIALFAEYTLDEFALHMTVLCSTMHNIMPRHGAETLAFTNKIVRRPYRRNEDGLAFFWTWFANGPSHPDTIASVQRLDAIHMKVAKHLPGNFADNDDYLYTVCMIGIFNHRLLHKLGLPGMPPHMQIAMHHFMRDLTRLFHREDGATVADFPADFAAMVAFCDAWELRPHAYTPVGTDVCNAMIADFSHRWFPAPLRGFARVFMLYSAQEKVVEHFRLGKLGPVSRFMTHWVLKTMFYVKLNWVPDAKVSFVRRRVPMSAEAVLAADRAAAQRADQAGWSRGGQAALGRKDESPQARCPMH